MYLSELELVGFKSFADKTVIRFTDGLTAIVGPNGCGKSNIVDAIRWVLGEQRTSVLRSDSMQNVIFNGSRTRKPLGMAEVSITLQNTKNILPTEYSEVRITRRLFRDGESQYLLNKNRCRYRDIQDLLMDTGIGANAYSVIELGMIDLILSEQHDERRKIFDEAAGITRYKVRRKETQRRLDALQSDIARIQDLVLEVERTVRSLSRQAKKAERYEELRQQMLRYLQFLLVTEYQQYFPQLQQIQQKLAALQQRKQEEEEEFVDKEIAVAELEQQVGELEEQLEAKRSEFAASRHRSEQLEREILLKKERQQTLREKIAQLQQLQQQLAQRQTEIAEAFIQLEEKKQKQMQTVQEQEEQLQQQIQKLQQIKQQLDGFRTHLAALQQQRFNLSEYISGLQTKSEKEKAKIAAIERRIADVEQFITEQSDRKTQLQEQLHKLQLQLQGYEQQLQEYEQQLQQQQQKKQDLESTLERLRTEKAELQSEIRHVEASIEFLNNLVVSEESSRFLLEHSSWSAKHRPSLLAESLQIDPAFEDALSTVLGPYLQAVVVEQPAAVSEAFDLLQSARKGRTTIIALEQLPSDSTPPVLPQIPGAVGFASEIPHVEDQRLRTLLRMLIGSVLLVESPEVVPAALQQENVTAVVTLDGILASSYGLYRGGSRLPDESALIGRKQKLEALQQKMTQLQQKMQALDQEIATVTEQLHAIDLEQLRRQLRNIEQQRNTVQQHSVRIESQIESIDKSISRSQEEYHSLQEEKTVILQHTADEQPLLEKALQRKTELEQELEQLQRKEEEVAQLHDQLSHAVQELRTAIANGKAEIAKIDFQRERYEVEQQRIAQEKVQAQQQIGELREQIERFEQEIEQQKRALMDAKHEMKRWQEQLQEEEQNLRQCRIQLQQQLQLLQQDQEEIHSVQEQIYELQLQMQTIESRLERLEEQSREHFHLPIDRLSLPEGEFPASVEEVRLQYQEMRQKLEQFGPVNLLAFEEYKQAQERLQFLQEQLNDLLEAEKNLKATIREINRTATAQFQECFQKIRHRFQELFQILFEPGDEADLFLSGDDPLEARIEIIAKPRGKRPHSIDMLSAGEKTLTAIALLFAIYFIKPSPFCVLDEVDAPLDDANIDRFLNLLRELQKSTQFILITHNKRTMEAADVLYGVTMAEDGVSRIVSVKLQELVAESG